MYIVLKGTLEVTIIVVYMPQSDRPSEEKQKADEDLQKVIDKRKSKGPIYILGDWNARLTYPNSETEELVMGKHTMHNSTATMSRFTEAMRENRELMLECSITNTLQILNTMYRKPLTKTATYRKSKKTQQKTNK